jgi:hypothetical protein
MPAKSDPRDKSAGAEYFYRRSLSARELLPAIGIGVAAAVVAFYVARIVIQRTPLAPELVASRRKARSQLKQGG